MGCTFAGDILAWEQVWACPLWLQFAFGSMVGGSAGMSALPRGPVILGRPPTAFSLPDSTVGSAVRETICTRTIVNDYGSTSLLS